MSDEEFYWNSITNELIGNNGTRLSLAFLQANGTLISRQTFLHNHETYQYSNYGITWDVTADEPVQVLSLGTLKILYHSPSMKYGAKLFGLKTEGKRISIDDLQKDLSKAPKKQQKKKRELQKWRSHRH